MNFRVNAMFYLLVVGLFLIFNAMTTSAFGKSSAVENGFTYGILCFRLILSRFANELDLV